MTQETKHTPIPHYYFVAEGGMLTGTLYKRTVNELGGNPLETPIARGIMKHHADEIVRACNTHEDLVRAVEQALSFAEKGTRLYPDELKAALRKARGEA